MIRTLKTPKIQQNKKFTLKNKIFIITIEETDEAQEELKNNILNDLNETNIDTTNETKLFTPVSQTQAKLFTPVPPTQTQAKLFTPVPQTQTKLFTPIPATQALTVIKTRWTCYNYRNNKKNYKIFIKISISIFSNDNLKFIYIMCQREPSPLTPFSRKLGRFSFPFLLFFTFQIWYFFNFDRTIANFIII